MRNYFLQKYNHRGRINAKLLTAVLFPLKFHLYVYKPTPCSPILYSPWELDSAGVCCLKYLPLGPSSPQSLLLHQHFFIHYTDSPFISFFSPHSVFGYTCIPWQLCIDAIDVTVILRFSTLLNVVDVKLWYPWISCFLMSIFLFFLFFFFLQKGLIKYAQYICLILVAKIHQVIF